MELSLNVTSSQPQTASEPYSGPVNPRITCRPIAQRSLRHRHLLESFLQTISTHAVAQPRVGLGSKSPPSPINRTMPSGQPPRAPIIDTTKPRNLQFFFCIILAFRLGNIVRPVFLNRRSAVVPKGYAVE
jgi:hypothetical protein